MLVELFSLDVDICSDNVSFFLTHDQLLLQYFDECTGLQYLVLFNRTLILYQSVRCLEFLDQLAVFIVFVTQILENILC